MHILLTNDDGIHAPGLRALAVERGVTQLTDQGYATITRLTWDLRHPMDDGDLNEIGL